MPPLLPVVVVGALLASSGLVLLLARWLWHQDTASLCERLARGAAGHPQPPCRAAALQGLPDPVARYLRRVLPEGQAPVIGATIHWRGEFNLGRPGADRWRPLSAWQRIVPGAAGFVWDARIRLFPGVAIFVRDSLVEGEAVMDARLFGLVRMASAQGRTELASAARQRLLGELLWLPTALAPGSGVQWRPIDAQAARATLGAGAGAATLDFRFGPDGSCAEVFSAARSYADGRQLPVPRPWRARLEGATEAAGLTVPARGEAEWWLPSGRFGYWRGQVVRIEFDRA